MLSSGHWITLNVIEIMLTILRLPTFDNIECYRTSIRQHSITFNVIEPAVDAICDRYRMLVSTLSNVIKC
jgi:hypothetical protein